MWCMWGGRGGAALQRCAGVGAGVVVRMRSRQLGAQTAASIPGSTLAVSRAQCYSSAPPLLWNRPGCLSHSSRILSSRPFSSAAAGGCVWVVLHPQMSFSQAGAGLIVCRQSCCTPKVVGGGGNVT